MKRSFLAIAAFLGWIGLASAQSSQATDTVSVTNAWARATAGKSKTGAVYVTLTDSGSPDRLVAVSTPLAGMAQLHQTISVKGVMQMRPIDALPLESGKPVTFGPGGYHIMLMDLHHPLKRGDTFPLTLTFDRARPVTVQVRVAGPGAINQSDSMPGMQDMNMPRMKP